jgi:hypothetical protein
MSNIAKNKMDSFSAKGTISSLIFENPNTEKFDVFNATKFILSGDWNMAVDGGKINEFISNISTALDDGTHSHTHEFTNFQTSKHFESNPDDNISISGIMDIGINSNVAWQNVNTTILISKFKTITISPDHNATANHFIGQSIYGMVDSIK